MQNSKSILVLLVASLCLTACVSQVPIESSARSAPSEEITVTGVNVITMDEQGTIIRGATVSISGSMIKSINGPVSPDAQIIDGRGKWLMPGLIDMHSHNLADIHFGEPSAAQGPTMFFDTQDTMLLYVANGVTTTFELNSRASHIGQRNEVSRGDIVGPRLALAFVIDGGDDVGRANTPAEGRQNVRVAKAMGYHFIKAYDFLNVETFHAVIDEAAKLDMKVVGHIPDSFKGKVEQAFVPNFGLIAHVEELQSIADEFSDEEAKRLASLAKENGTWVIPNLTNMVSFAQQARSVETITELPGYPYVHPVIQEKWITSNSYNQGTSPERVAEFERRAAFHRDLVRALKTAGVPMVTGTDAGVSGLIWGYAVHDELELLVDAGLTEEEALEAGTLLPAKWLGLWDRLGSVEPGKLADLILLKENPLEDIRHSRTIEGVFFNGRYVDAAQIDAALDELKNKNEDNYGKIKWADRRKLGDAK